MKKRRVTLFLTFIIIITLLLVSFTVYINQPTKTICIDAGHGGFDGGAVYNNTLEKDITLKASSFLGRMLEDTGYCVIYTRTTDKSLSKDRIYYLGLHEYFNDIVDAEKNRINAPTVIKVNSGNLVGYHIDTVPSHTINDAGVLPALTEEQKIELHTLLTELFNK